MLRPKLSLDRIDRKILAVLQEDGRISNADLAERVGLSASPCLRRTRALEEAGIIRSYKAELDARNLGLDILAFVEIRITRHGGGAAEQFRDTMLKHPMVIGCYMVTGAYDFLLKVIAADLESFKSFTIDTLLAMPDVQDVRTSIVLDRVKDTSALSIPD